MQHVSFSHCTKCVSIHPLTSSEQHSKGEEASTSQGQRALHHFGMMGSSCPCQPTSQPGTAQVHLASVTLTEKREEGTGTPCCSVTGTKWCLPSRVLTREQAQSQDTSETSWRMGRQLSSVSGPLDLKDHLSLHTHSHLAEGD